MDAQFNKLKEILSMAINELKLKDYYLLEKDVNERSITHKLAGYLQKHLSEHFDEHYDVDCEYNRNVYKNSKKTIHLPQEKKLEKN